MKKVTVLSELRSEFAGLIARMQKVVAAFTTKHPKLIFCAMVALMLCSFLLCFTLLRMKSESVPKKLKVFSKIEGNLGEIGTTARKLKSILEVRSALEVLLAKDSLTKKDSLLMEQLLGAVDKSMTIKK
ncbi:hypothetical protein ASU31_00095 [Pedobacter ginsenosidimutans]|uniref:Uncharacterized protein n=1 Tax=Pedobacter ginsenosidimutans TaxID=687842 RepID=A0A0T5VV49_9SPHI|nr:hypothetical protein [Pedobacter ginsenosidimutans]KRT17734.1 hypothetical protein ASU31_00095 [Pedobacter ginsenosidimutans]